MSHIKVSAEWWQEEDLKRSLLGSSSETQLITFCHDIRGCSGGTNKCSSLSKGRYLANMLISLLGALAVSNASGDGNQGK